MVNGNTTEDNPVEQCAMIGDTSIAMRYLPIGGVGDISYSIRIGNIVMDDPTTEEVDESAMPILSEGDAMTTYRISGMHSYVAAVDAMDGAVKVTGIADRKSAASLPVTLMAEDMFDNPATMDTDYQMAERALLRNIEITRRAITDQDAHDNYLPATANQDVAAGSQSEAAFSAGDYPSRMGAVEEHLKLHYTANETKYEVTGSIQGVDDEDWFVITNVAPDYAIHVQIVGNAQFDLYSAAGAKVTSRKMKDEMGMDDPMMEDPDLADFNKAYVDLRCGDYFVKVTGKDGAEDDYTLGWRVDTDGDAKPAAEENG